MSLYIKGMCWKLLTETLMHDKESEHVQYFLQISTRPEAKSTVWDEKLLLLIRLHPEDRYLYCSCQKKQNKKKKFQPGALKSLRSFTHKCLSGTCQMCHPFRFLGDEWLFGGCTVSLQEASQIKRQLWILEVPTLWSLMSTVSAKFSLGMYRRNLWDFSVWSVWRQVSPRTVGDGRGWVPEGGG